MMAWCGSWTLSRFCAKHAARSRRLATNSLRLNIGDDVFIYTGDHDLGIIGYASVERVERKGRKIELLFDKRKCLQLIDKPVPARLVRECVKQRFSAVVG